MGAFIIAALIFVGTLLLSALILFAAGMSDNPSASAGAGRSALGTLIGGTVLSAIILASHWMPHIGW